MSSASALLDPGSLAKMIATEESRIRLQGDSADTIPLCIQISLGQFDVLSWLKSISNTPRYYWNNRDQTLEFGGIGNALKNHIWLGATLAERLDELQLLLRRFKEGSQIKAFVGGVFDPDTKMDTVWQGFPQQCIHLPEMCVIRENGQVNALITMFLGGADDQHTQVERVIELARTLKHTKTLQDCELGAASRHDIPDRAGWKEAVDTSITAIAAGQIEKIVLARRTDYLCEQDVDAIDLLSHLSESAANCYRILYVPIETAAFLSVSPERLFLCNGKLLSTEAVAGTIRRGNSEIEDLALESRLRTNAKDHAEQRIVVEGITESLRPLCEKIEFSSTSSVMKLSRVQHLISEFRAILAQTATIGGAYGALHPTAAVCGTPKQRTLDLVRELESFARGWYASAIGVVGIDHCEFAVGIRSGVLRGNTLSLFTGAGIVSQSDPETEWQELEDKLHSVLQIGIGSAV